MSDALRIAHGAFGRGRCSTWIAASSGMRTTMRSAAPLCRCSRYLIAAAGELRLAVGLRFHLVEYVRPQALQPSERNNLASASAGGYGRRSGAITTTPDRTARRLAVLFRRGHVGLEPFQAKGLDRTVRQHLLDRLIETLFQLAIALAQPDRDPATEKPTAE